VNLIVKDPFQRKIEIANWVILAFLFIPSLFFAPLKFAAGVLFGGFISIINFHWLAHSLRGMFKNPAGNVKGPALIKYYIRLALTAIVLFCLIAGDLVDVIGLLIGLSVVVINIVVIMITSLAKKKLLEEVS
jgi:ATP synthase I chain